MGEYAMAIVWAVIFIAALVIESQTAELVAIWFLPGALISLVLSFFNVPVWIQITVFAVLSAALLVLAFKFFRSLILKDVGRTKTDTDLLIGKHARVEEDIDNAQMQGAVKIDGKIWSARMVDDSQKATVGEFVTVESISGVKLICKKG